MKNVASQMFKNLFEYIVESFPEESKLKEPSDFVKWTLASKSRCRLLEIEFSQFMSEKKFAYYAKIFIHRTVSREILICYTRDWPHESPSEILAQFERRFGFSSPGVLGGTQFAQLFPQIQNVSHDSSKIFAGVDLLSKTVFYNRDTLNEKEFRDMIFGYLIAHNHPTWWRAIATDPSNDGTADFFLNRKFQILYR